jgi:hypothetical protein
MHCKNTCVRVVFHISDNVENNEEVNFLQYCICIDGAGVGTGSARIYIIWLKPELQIPVICI